jgi:hypothetical protein
MNSSPISVPSSAAVVMAPQFLDAGNWAIAIGVYDGPLITNFFQVRLAGSAATVINSSIAQQAVNAGLWSSVNDYFEFPSQHAGVSQKGALQSGPSNFESFVIPEPQACALIAMAGIASLGCARRRA